MLVFGRPAEADAALVGPGLGRQRTPPLARVRRELDAFPEKYVGYSHYTIKLVIGV